MKYIIDTHILVWYMTKSQKLSKEMVKILDSQNNEFVIPIIVLAEIKYLCSKNRISADYDVLFNMIAEMNNVTIYNIDLNVIEKLPLSLNIHDSLIVSTALVFKEILNEDAELLTVDEEIISFMRQI